MWNKCCPAAPAYCYDVKHGRPVRSRADRLNYTRFLLKFSKTGSACVLIYILLHILSSHSISKQVDKTSLTLNLLVYLADYVTRFLLTVTAILFIQRELPGIVCHTELLQQDLNYKIEWNKFYLKKMRKIGITKCITMNAIKVRNY